MYFNNREVDFFILFSLTFGWPIFIKTESDQRKHGRQQKMAVCMFQESWKFQASEKEASKQQMTKRQEKTESWSERGRSAFVKAQIHTLRGHLAKLKTEFNVSSFIQKLETLLSTEDSTLKNTILVRDRQS